MSRSPTATTPEARLRGWPVFVRPFVLATRPDAGRSGGEPEGVDHPRQIEQRRHLEPALLQVAIGLTFEVDDEQIVTGQQDLPQVEIAMTADPEPAQWPCQQPAESREHLLFAIR